MSQARQDALIRQLQGALGGNRLLRGTVSAAGAVIGDGTGWSVNKTGTGTYVVTFASNFRSIPSVVVGAGHTGGDYAAKVSVAPTVSGFTVLTFVTSAGTAADGAWHFIAAGP